MILLTQDDFIKMFNEQIKPSYSKADVSIAYRAYDIYLSTSMEELNVKRNKEEQQSEATMLMQQIHLIDLQDFSTNDYLDSIRRLENQFRDVRKFTYFDNFLYQGASDDIMKILKQYNIPTKALKGLKPSLPFDEVTWTSSDGKQVRIIQEVTKNPSIVIEVFDIYYDGKLIFSLDQQVSEEDRFTMDRPPKEEPEEEVETKEITEKVNKAKAKHKKNYSKTITVKEKQKIEKIDEYKINKVSKTGRKYTKTFYKGAGGRFVKNPYRS